MALSGRNSQFTKREIPREIFRTVFWGAPVPESIKMAKISVKMVVHMVLDLILKDLAFPTLSSRKVDSGMCALK